VSRFRSLLLLPVVFMALAQAVDAPPEQLLRAGRADEARRVLNAAVNRNPDDAQAYNLLARMYFQLELWDSSLKMAEKAANLQQNNSDYHLWLGRAAGRKAEASNPFTAWGLARRVHAEFERAVALNGDNLSARSDLAEYYLEAPAFLGGDKKRARDQGDAVRDKDPALASYIFAKIAEKQGSSSAEEQYKQAIRQSGNQSRYWIELAHFYRRAGRLTEMDAAVAQAMAGIHQDSAPEYEGAYLFLRTNRNLNNAVQMLRRYLSNTTASEDAPAFRAHYLLGELLLKQGDKKGAAEQYRACLLLASEFRPAQDALARLSR
jgi:tetratricopeptide (TPR) repeat protein